jgi:ubiquitin related modifier 1
LEITIELNKRVYSAEGRSVRRESTHVLDERKHLVIDSMNVVLEFSGGAELLFDKKRLHQISLPQQTEQWTVGRLLAWIKDNILLERPELFLKDPAASKLDVRPGILVLINEADWELMGQTDYALEDGDTIAFISTLHGG